MCMYSLVMSTKCITITNDAYERLAVFKEPSESFSEVIVKLTRHNSMLELVGVLSNKEARELKSNVKELRKRIRSRVDAMAERLK